LASHSIGHFLPGWKIPSHGARIPNRARIQPDDYVASFRGKTFYFRARLLDRTGNLGAWTEWVRGESSKDTRLLLDQLRDDILTTKAGKELIERIDRTELSMNSRFNGIGNALNNYSKKIVLTKQINRHKMKEVQERIATLDKALNSYKVLVATQFDQAKAETLEIKKT